MRYTPNKNIYECAENIRVLCKAIQFELNLLTNPNSDIASVEEAIRRRCNDIDEARRSLERHSGISEARDSAREQFQKAIERSKQ